MRAGVQPSCFTQRIENGVGDGVPDIWLCSRENGRGAWVELKYRPCPPARPSTPIFTGSYGLRAEQVAWIYSRASTGAAIYVLGQCADDVWLMHGRYARDLAGMTADDLVLTADWYGSARRTDWGGMLEVIFGETA